MGVRTEKLRKGVYCAGDLPRRVCFFNEVRASQVTGQRRWGSNWEANAILGKTLERYNPVERGISSHSNVTTRGTCAKYQNDTHSMCNRRSSRQPEDKPRKV